MSKKLLLNSISGTLLFGVNIVIVFIMSPVLIRVLGNRDYGLWELVMSVVGYMGLLDMGVGPAVLRFVSVADAKRDFEDLQKTISTGLALFLVIGVIAVIAFWGLASFPSLIAGIDASKMANLQTVFYLLAVNAALLFPRQVFTATLMGMQRHAYINYVRIIIGILQAFLTYNLIYVYQDKGLLILALLTPIFTGVQFAAFGLALYRTPGFPGFSFSSVSFGKIKEMFGFAAKSITMLVASRLQDLSVPFIIGHAIGLGQIVYFTIPNRLITHAKGFSNALGFPFTSYFGAAVGRGDKNELVNSWFKTTMALQIVSLAMPITVFFCGGAFLRLWLGNEYSEESRLVLYVLMVGLVADSLAGNAFRVLTASGRHGRSAVLWLLLSVISIPMGVGGAHLWGVNGAAIGTTMVSFFGNLITLAMACRMFGVSASVYVEKTFLKTMIPLLLLIASMGTLIKVFPLVTYANLLIVLVFSGTLYLISVWIFTLSADIKIMVRNKIKNIYNTRPFMPDKT